MGTNFSHPFALTSQGTIAITTDPNAIANTRVESLIGTYPGERVMQPTYGVDINSYLFTPNVVRDTDMVATDIRSSLAIWEPSITLITINSDLNEVEYGVGEINVEFTISNNPTFKPSMTATVLVGGEVVND